jgi:hypothetical protein
MKYYFRNMSFTTARRDLPLVLVAKTASLLGDEIAAVTLVLRLQAHGAGTGAIAALLGAALLPIVLLAPVVGRLVDGHDSRVLLVISSLIQAALCAVLVWQTSTPAILVLVAALGAGQAVNSATWQALLPAIAGPDGLPRSGSTRPRTRSRRSRRRPRPDCWSVTSAAGCRCWWTPRATWRSLWRHCSSPRVTAGPLPTATSRSVVASR